MHLVNLDFKIPGFRMGWREDTAFGFRRYKNQRYPDLVSDVNKVRVP